MIIDDNYKNSFEIFSIAEREETLWEFEKRKKFKEDDKKKKTTKKDEIT